MKTNSAWILEAVFINGDGYIAGVFETKAEIIRQLKEKGYKYNKEYKYWYSDMFPLPEFEIRGKFKLNELQVF